MSTKNLKFANTDLTGRIAMTARTSAPPGYLKCNGAAISRTTYADLFAVIGTIYGTGDGSTTFNVPDMRGNFIRGWDDGRGVDSGRALATEQTDYMQDHTHYMTGESGGNDNIVAGQTTNYGTQYTFHETGTGRGDAMIYVGSGKYGRFASEVRPRNISLLACIKF